MGKNGQKPADVLPAGVARRRDVAVEALRLFAICGIALFHTFQPFFDSFAYHMGSVPTGWIGAGSAFVLGLVSLLGAAGNCVFFMISGFYLLPRMRGQAGMPGYWTGQARTFCRRAAVILASIGFYALVGLVLQALGARLFFPGRPFASWLFGGLEFIWLYLVVLALAPVCAWAAARLGRKSASAGPLLVFVLCLCVVALNQWIAFADRGSFTRGLLDWRKLMSGATYLAAFLLAGLMGQRRKKAARAAIPAFWTVLAAAIAAEAVAAMLAAQGRVFLLGALSYKSTSALSFLSAAALLACACRHVLRHPAERLDEPEPRAAGIVRRLASSILGFYICQSLLFVPWHVFCTQTLSRLVAPSRAPGHAAPLAFFLAGFAASLLFALVLMAFDLLARRPLIRLLRLGRTASPVSCRR